MKRIALVNNDIEAQVLEAALREREIPFLLKSYHDSALDGLLQAVQGWGHLEAPPEFEDEVLEILGAIRTQSPNADDGTME